MTIDDAFSETDLPRRDGLARRGVTAALWNYVGNGTRAFFTLVVGVVLARILGPEAFGLAAIGWLAINAGTLFGDLGFSAAIVRQARIMKRDVDFVFTMQLVTNGAIALLIILIAPWLARFFAQPQAVNIVRVMALSLILRSLGQTSSALLARDLRFRMAQIVGVISYSVGFGGVGIILALTGFGAWSLVGAQLAQTALGSAGVLLMTRRRIGFALRPSHPEITRTGLTVIVANFSSFGIANIDSVIVGHVAGPVMLGLYNRAFSLAMMPAMLIVNGLYGVMLSGSSRIQTEQAKLRAVFLGSIALLVLLSGSALATMAMISETVVTALLGDQWRGAIPVLAALSLAAIVHGALAFSGPMLTATGNARKEAQAQWIVLPIMAVMVYAAARHSVVAAAWTVLAAYLLRMAILYWKVHQGLAFEWRETCLAVIPPLCAAAITGGITKSVDLILPHLPPVSRLVIDMGVAGATLCLTTLLLRPYLARGPLGYLLRTSGVLPARLRKIMLME